MEKYPKFLNKYVGIISKNDKENITPLHIESAQSNVAFSLKNPPIMGGLNEKRCKIITYDLEESSENNSKNQEISIHDFNMDDNLFLFDRITHKDFYYLRSNTLS